MQLRVHVQQEEARMANSLATSVVDFDAEVSILDMGVKFTYQVPSFSVLHVDLRQTKLQVTAEDGSVLLYDGFIRADPSLDDKETPYSVKVKDFCFVPVEEFSKNVYAKHLNAVGELGLLIVWQWSEWTDDEGSKPSESPEPDPNESLSTASDLDEEEPELSTVTFKCIGVTRDPMYQDCLKTVSGLLQAGTTVPVKVIPEPNNPFDSRALAFQCLIDNKWQVIGYVIKELCDIVHEAIADSSIISVRFAWVRYKVVRTTGPGYYAAIEITRKGKWPPIIHRSASTIY